ncbi:MAG TPA: hypothetical protein DCE56_08545 [Cyanobacteria bacterium UBA8553]|nr:hypothetical protein [Cyanobacteria bacterium UBA8553]
MANGYYIELQILDLYCFPINAKHKDRVYLNCLLGAKVIAKTRPYEIYMLMCSIIKGNWY